MLCCILIKWIGENKKNLTSGSTGVFATEMALAFTQEIVFVTLTTTPVEFLTAHRSLIVAPALESTLTTSSILWLLAFVCSKQHELNEAKFNGNHTQMLPSSLGAIHCW
jgi:hypothetical protein